MKKVLLLFVCFYISTIIKAQISYEAVPDYGKIWNILYDKFVPGKLYGTSLVNQVLVSEDDGATWKILYTFPHNNSVISNLKLLPGAKALSFVVKFSDSTTTDGLYIYNLQNSTITKHFIAPNYKVNPYINAYSIYDADASVIAINTSFSFNFSPYSQSFYTKDGGNKWSLIYYSESHNNVQINNIAINPANASNIFLMRGLGPENVNGGLWVSDDEGKTWKVKLNGFAIDPVAFNPNNADEMLAGTGISFGATPEHLFHSSNGGKTWDTVAVGWSDGILNNINSIVYDETNAKNVWLLEENEYANSKDGGLTWTNTSFPLETPLYYNGTSISINPFNSKEIKIVSDGFPASSDNNGRKLTQIKNAFYDVHHLAFANYSGNKHLFYASQGGYLDKNIKTNKSKAYEIQSPFIINPTTRQFFPDTTKTGRVFIFTPSNGFNNSSLGLSDDFGATQTSVPADEFSNNLSAFAKDPNMANAYWAVFSSYGTSNIYLINTANATNPLSKKIYSVQNDINGICLLKNEPNVVFIAIKNKVYKSSNRGATWKLKSDGLNALMIYDLKTNPKNKNEIIAATDAGLFVSYNKAETWQQMLSGYSINKVDFSPVIKGEIIAGVYNSPANETTILYSANDGTNWSILSPESLLHIRAVEMSFGFYRDSIHIYCATPDLGIVKYALKNLSHPSENNAPANLFVDNSISKQNTLIYPNPFTDIINVISSASKQENCLIKLVDLNGRPYYSSVHLMLPGMNSFNIPAADLPKGMYVIRIEKQDGTSEVYNLLK